ncbi:MAG: response regulator [Oligoflexia bacterium]|nr:response regulator [Oligoflexia bacterium]MBF0364733.1 response regulator [Oligoflexia bacterium]
MSNLNQPTKITILIVDDEKNILFILHEKTREFCSEIFMAENGIEAIAILENKKIDCVLCDIRMPLMNGAELIKIARQKGIDTPFIFFTGHACEELMQEVLRYGAFDFIEKPDFDNLIECMNKGIERGFSKNDALKVETEFFSDYEKVLSKKS